MTNELIGCCGLDCEVCDARLATLNNDDEPRIQLEPRGSRGYIELRAVKKK